MPCGPLHADLTGISFDLPPGVNDRVDLSLRMSLKTVADLPVSIPLVGDCGVHVDTAPGASSTIQVDVPLNLSADGLHVNALGAVSLTGLTTDDVSITGGFGCQVANLGLGFFLNTLQATLVQSLVPFEGLCLGRQSTP